MNWERIDVTLDDPLATCPTIIYSPHQSPENNLEWWGLDFDNPADPESAGYLVGGIGNTTGYMYKTSGMDPTSESWIGTWEQLKNYEVLPGAIGPNSCSPTTQYDVVVLDPPSSPKVPVSVGYASQLFEDHTSGFPNYDSCNCAVIEPPTSIMDPTWVQQMMPELKENGAKPLFRAIAKIDSTKSCAAGGFGRIVIHDTSGTVTDVGSRVPRRPDDAAFIDTMTFAAFGQHLDVDYTEDGGVTWTEANVDEEEWFHDGGHHGRGIAFDSTGAHGIAVGDQLSSAVFDPPFAGKGFLARTTGSQPTPWTDWQMVDPEIVGSPTVAPMDLRDVIFAPDDTAYAVGQNGWIAKSVDWGVSWERLTIPGASEKTLNAVSFETASIGVVVGVGGHTLVYITTDAGDNWQSTGIGTETVFDIETWGNGSNQIAVGEDGGVWVRTVNRFERVDWQDHPQVGDVTGDLLDVEVIGQGDQVWVCGNDGVLLYRDPAGNWSKPPSGTSEALVKVAFPTSSVGYAVGITFTILKND